MATTETHASGAEYVEVESDPPGGAPTLLFRVGEWTARLDVVVEVDGEDGGERVVEVAAYEVASGKVDGELLPPGQAGLVDGEPDGDQVAVFLFDDDGGGGVGRGGRCPRRRPPDGRWGAPWRQRGVGSSGEGRGCLGGFGGSVGGGHVVLDRPWASASTSTSTEVGRVGGRCATERT